MTTFNFFWDSNLLTIFPPWLSSLKTISHTLPRCHFNPWPLSLQTVIACTYVCIYIPSHIRSYTCKVSPTWLPNVSWPRMTSMNRTHWMEKSPQGLRPTQTTIGNWKQLATGEVVHPRAQHDNWSSSTKWSTLKTYIELALHGLNKLYLRPCLHWWQTREVQFRASF